MYLLYMFNPDVNAVYDLHEWVESIGRINKLHHFLLP